MITGKRASLWSLAVAAAVLAAASAVLDGIGFAPTGLTGNDVSLRKSESLREHARREGPSDLVLVGSSLSYRGLDPAEVAAALAAAVPVARPPRVYNFAVWGHGALTYPVLMGLVLDADRPRVVAIEVGHRAIEATPGRAQLAASRVLGSAYGQSFSDPIPARGWLRRRLLRHASLASCGPRLREVLLGEGLEPIARGGLDPARGFLAPPAEPPADLGLAHRSGLLWQTSTRHLEGVERAVRMAQEAGAAVVLYDVPVSARALGLLRNPDDPLPALRGITRELAVRLGADAIQLPDPVAADDQFVDLDHVTRAGAHAWSRSLGAALARARPELAAPPQIAKR